MERLVIEKYGELLIKNADCEYRSPCFGCESIRRCNPYKMPCSTYKALEKLKEYEDLEEQGRLSKLPCKLGDVTYWISDEDHEGNKVPTVMENEPIVSIAIAENGLYILVDGDEEHLKVGTRWAFLTKEEAETALKEM